MERVGMVVVSNAETSRCCEPSSPKGGNECDGCDDRGVVRGVSGGVGPPEEGELE